MQNYPQLWYVFTNDIKLVWQASTCSWYVFTKDIKGVMYIQYIFDTNLWSWIFFPRSKVLERSGRRPSSGGTVPRGRSHAIFLIRARSVIVSCMRSVYEPFIFMRDPCVICMSFCAPHAHDVFIGPGFEPLHFQCNHFVGPGFDSWVRSPVAGQ